MNDTSQDDPLPLDLTGEPDLVGPPSCPLCDGVGLYLGQLGLLIYFKCQQCGIEFHYNTERNTTKCTTIPF